MRSMGGSTRIHKRTNTSPHTRTPTHTHIPTTKAAALVDFLFFEQGPESDDRPHFLFNVLVRGT